jgi:putative membrane protein
LTHTVSLVEFAVWALLAGVIQIVTFLIVQHFVMRDFNDRIVRGEIAAATYMASISLCVGILNAACMTN